MRTVSLAKPGSSKSLPRMVFCKSPSLYNNLHEGLHGQRPACAGPAEPGSRSSRAAVRTAWPPTRSPTRHALVSIQKINKKNNSIIAHWVFALFTQEQGKSPELLLSSTLCLKLRLAPLFTYGGNWPIAGNECHNSMSILDGREETLQQDQLQSILTLMSCRKMRPPLLFWKDSSLSACSLSSSLFSLKKWEKPWRATSSREK